jgi:hypothetical protein
MQPEPLKHGERRFVVQQRNNAKAFRWQVLPPNDPSRIQYTDCKVLDNSKCLTFLRINIAIEPDNFLSLGEITPPLTIHLIDSRAQRFVQGCGTIRKAPCECNMCLFLA